MAHDLFYELSIARKQLWNACSESLSSYLHNVTIASSPAPSRFGDIAEPWQRELLAPKIPAFEHLMGLRDDYKGPRNLMSILSRGHDKSSLEGRLCNAALLFSKRQIKGYIFASDEDQGKLILQAMEEEARLNPWFYDRLTFRNGVVLGPSGFVEVLPADSGSAYGLRGNLFIADEFTHWKNDRLWRAVVSGKDKVSPNLLVVLSNAGVLDTWQHNVFLEAQANPKKWSLFYREGMLASWIDPEAIADTRKLLPPFEGDRLYGNLWIDPAAEADYLRKEEIAGCIALAAHLRLSPQYFGKPGIQNYVGAIDYGPRRDRTALCIVHLDLMNRVIVDRLDVWQGSPDSPTSIDRVEQWIETQHKKFHPVLWVVDPYQMEGTIQDMERKSIPVERFASRGGAGTYQLAQLLRALVVEARLLWYPGAGDLVLPDGKIESFADELRYLRVKKMPYGFRFDHLAQKHDDRAVAVTMAALRAIELSQAPVIQNLQSIKLPATFAR